LTTPPSADVPSPRLTTPPSADVPSAPPERGRNDEEWVERSFDLPAGIATARTPIELRAAPEAITTFHYWCSTVGPIP
jgi:hypothetical protein